jgi:uncharacterized membrane protein
MCAALLTPCRTAEQTFHHCLCLLFCYVCCFHAATPSAFGGGSTFGAASSGGGLFGGASTPAFGAPSAASPFGGTSTPAFGTPGNCCLLSLLLLRKIWCVLLLALPAVSVGCLVAQARPRLARRLLLALLEARARLPLAHQVTTRVVHCLCGDCRCVLLAFALLVSCCCCAASCVGGLFGGASTPAFGAPSAASPVGGTSTPAFGTPGNNTSCTLSVW